MSLKLVRARKGGDTWYIRGTIRGRRIEESTGTDDRRRAEELRARREGELLDEAIHGRAATATFAHAALSYLEQGGERRFVAPLLRHFGTTALARIGQVEIEAAARILYPGRKPSTINRQIHTPLSAILKHAAARGMCELRPIERPRQPRGRLRWLTPDEARRLLGACNADLRPLVILMLYTGARVSEALYLDWADVDLARAHVAYLDTKNGLPRGVPLAPIAVAALANLPHRAGPVFRRPDGMPYAPRDGEGGQIKTAFRGAVRRAGLGWIDTKEGREVWRTDVTPHVLRHTWATWHYAAHRDVASLQQLGGWASIEMVMRYVHINTDHLAAQIAALPVIGGYLGEAKASGM